jgi:hypothetical protein
MYIDMGNSPKPQVNNVPTATIAEQKVCRIHPWIFDQLIQGCGPNWCKHRGTNDPRHPVVKHQVHNSDDVFESCKMCFDTALDIYRQPIMQPQPPSIIFREGYDRMVARYPNYRCACLEIEHEQDDVFAMRPKQGVIPDQGYGRPVRICLRCSKQWNKETEKIEAQKTSECRATVEKQAKEMLT